MLALLRVLGKEAVFEKAFTTCSARGTEIREAGYELKAQGSKLKAQREGKLFQAVQLGISFRRLLG